MKQIYINNEPTYFYIEQNGKVFSKKTNKFYKGSIRGGYRQFDLRWKNKKYTFSQHRLIAEYYIDNPNNYPIVHHKDGDRLNNSIENLEWVSYEINNLKINKHNNNNKKQNIILSNEKEIWINFRDTYYSISSCGKIKNNITNKIMKGKINDVGYLEYCLTINKKKKSFLAHRIIYEAFYNEIPKVINHKDGNKLNNNINNLENVTHRENNIKALYETKIRKYKKTAQYDKEMNLIQIFENNAEAARYMKITPQSIQSAIKNKYCCCNYYWRNIEE